jgi:hypothetical protein
MWLVRLNCKCYGPFRKKQRACDWLAANKGKRRGLVFELLKAR